MGRGRRPGAGGAVLQGRTGPVARRGAPALTIVARSLRTNKDRARSGSPANRPGSLPASPGPPPCQRVRPSPDGRRPSAARTRRCGSGTLFGAARVPPRGQARAPSSHQFARAAGDRPMQSGRAQVQFGKDVFKEEAVPNVPPARRPIGVRAGHHRQEDRERHAHALLHHVAGGAASPQSRKLLFRVRACSRMGLTR